MHAVSQPTRALQGKAALSLFTGEEGEYRKACPESDGWSGAREGFETTAIWFQRMYSVLFQRMLFRKGRSRALLFSSSEFLLAVL